jgi:cytochrome P450 family 9
MKARDQKGIVRQDMLNLLMQSQKGQLVHNNNEEKIVEGFSTVEESAVGRSEVKKTWTDNELIAQCLIFFFGGFDTVNILFLF